MSIMTAILLGFWLWFGHAHVPSSHLWWNGLTTGLWVGIVLGDIPTAVILGATFELFYLGAVGAAGGVALQDECAGCLVAIPAVMLSGLDTAAALAVALPVGLIFAQLMNATQFVNAFVNQYVDNAISRRKYSGVSFGVMVLPWLLRIVVIWLPISILIFLGGNAAAAIADNIPTWLTSGLSALGGIMPAVGIGIILYVMGNAIMLPFMLAGFFLVQYSGISTFGAAIVGAFLAFLYWLFMVRGKNTATSDPIAERPAILTKHDLNVVQLRWWVFALNAESWDRKTGLGFGNALLPALKKLYKNDPDGLQEAVARECQFFNTESQWGAVCPGVALAMEESKALGAPISGEAITAAKTGLMGPFAGIGDSITWGLVYFIIMGLCVSGASNGNAFVAVLPPILMMIYGFIVDRGMFNLGYKTGMSSASVLMKNGLFASFIPVLTVLGMFMAGAMGAGYVNVTTPIEIGAGAMGAASIQGILDGIAPGLLSLGAIFLSYFISKKFGKFIITALSMLVIGLVLGCLGIIG